MSWAVGYDENRQRFIGYGVTAYCDHPGCKAEIDRGIAHTCGGAPYGGDSGCGLHFCGQHLLAAGQLCERCAAPTAAEAEPFEPRGEHPKWAHHVLTDDSWNQWRADEPAKAKALVNHLLELATRSAPERAAPVAADVEHVSRQPIAGRLMDEVAQLPVLWGLGEPGALLRHSDVTRILVAVGKEYAAAQPPVDLALVDAKLVVWCITFDGEVTHNVFRGQEAAKMGLDRLNLKYPADAGKRAIVALRATSQPDSGRDAALREAVNAIYFDDGHKFQGALWNVVRHLSPSVHGLLQTDMRAAYYALAAQQGEKGVAK